MDERILARSVADLVRRDPAIVVALAGAGITPRYADWRLGDVLRDLQVRGSRLAALHEALAPLAAAVPARSR